MPVTSSNAPVLAFQKIGAGIIPVGQSWNFSVQPPAANTFWLLSKDAGQSWANQGTVVNGLINPNIQDDVGDSSNMHLLMRSDCGDPLYTLSTTGGGGTPIQWIGNAHHWPPNGQIDAGETLWFNLYTYPIGAASFVKAHYQVNGGAWQSVSMNHGPEGQNEHWWVSYVGFPAGATILYKFEVGNQQGQSSWFDNNGQNFQAKVNNGQPVKWVGNTSHYPPNGSLKATDDLWINTESWPAGAGVAAKVTYNVNGGTWTETALSSDGMKGNNDGWHVNLGKFQAGAQIKYAVAVQGGDGAWWWDNNGTKDFLAKVETNSAVQAPVFWELDHYRADHEKVRANGRAADGSKSFGSFTAGQAVTVVARPVENGNGNLGQGSVTMLSTLSYTVDNWAHFVTVTGVFSAAWVDNKPHFDYFSYAIGSLPVGSNVKFWLGAWNAAGAGYAQTAGNDFSFTVTGAVGDSDADGLPDQWEQDSFGNLDQNANGNPDGDGPTGRPLENIIEWAIGTSPTIGNDPMGIRLLWNPAYPVAGGQVTLSYFYVNEANPLFGRPVYAHVGKNNWVEGSVYDTAQLQLNGQISRFEIMVDVPADATELNVCFTDKAGRWDNNGGQNWRIPVKASSGGSGSGLQEASRTAPVRATSVSAASASESLAAEAPAKLVVKVTGRKVGAGMILYAGHDGWKAAKEIALRKRAGGAWYGECVLPAGAREANLALRDGKGRWDLNRGRGWTVRLAGNAEHRLTIQR